MLLQHSDSSYSWDNGKRFSGWRAKTYALASGCASLGIKKFRSTAYTYGISMYEIEMAVAEFRAKADVYQGPSRDGTMDIDDSLPEGTEDINQSEGSKLKTKTRDKLPDSDFAGPNRSFPITDKDHFEAALRDVGRLPKDQQAAVRRKILEIGRRKGYTEESK